MKYIITSVYYQLVIFSRIKQAVFFIIAFPIFIFLLFSSIWGIREPDYIMFIMSGVLGMTVASDGMFSIGGVIKEYYSTGLMRYLKKIDFNLTLHIFSLIVSRFFSIFFVMLILIAISIFCFNAIFSFEDLINYITGAFLGFTLFSFLGLSISFSNIKYKNTSGLINLFYYFILFTSDSFYPVGSFNEKIKFFGNLLPLNPILCVMRGEGFSLILLFWLITPFLLFIYFFNKTKFNR